MEDIVLKYDGVCSAIKKLKVEKKDLETILINKMNELNKENISIGNIALALYYKCRYEYDVKAIYDILEPKNLFIEVCSIKRKKLDFHIQRTDNLNESELDVLLNAIHIKKTYEYLRCRRNGS